MELRIPLRFLRLWNSSKEKPLYVINSRYIHAAVTYGTLFRKPLLTIQEGLHRNVSAFSGMHILHYHPKIMRKGNLFLKLLKQLMTKNITKVEVEGDWGGPEAFKLITFIKDTDFDDVLKNYSSVMVFFSASWCPHCRKLRKPYGMAAMMSKEANLPMTFATFDVGQNPEMADEKGVIGIPLIRYYKNGKFVTNYKGKRTAEDLFNFAKNPTEDSPPQKQSDI